MEFYDVIRSRRSIRAYRPDPVPAAALARIAEAVRQAPTACNRQAFRILAVSNPAIRAKICGACSMKFLPEAPVILVAQVQHSAAWRRPGDDHSIAELDLGIVMEHAVLAATAEGLASCWVCAYERARMDAALDAGAEWTTIALSPLGYAAAEPGPFQRKDAAETFQIIA